jgi:GTP cyclohydrolase I
VRRPPATHWRPEHGAARRVAIAAATAIGVGGDCSAPQWTQWRAPAGLSRPQLAPLPPSDVSWPAPFQGRTLALVPVPTNITVHRAPKPAAVAAIRIFTRQPVTGCHQNRDMAQGGAIFHTPVRLHRPVSRPSRPGVADMPIDVLKIEQLTRELLQALGEEPEREGLLKTPERVAKAMAFLTSGYRTDLTTLINGAIFTQTTNSMVIVKNIEVYSLCEHHMLPFFGRCHIGYIPTGRVFGVSKLARLVDMYARRLQLQERLTEQISQAVFESTTRAASA